MLWGAVKAVISAQRVEVSAVSSVTFSINPGESVALIGENGAGKSTTIKMLTGILKPSEGDLRVSGFVPWLERRQLALHIGVVFGQRPQLFWDIPVGETFRLLRLMYRIPDPIYKITYGLALKRLELEPLLDVPVRQLSLGQRMRCDLGASLLHAPDVAFLDEPTIGLDVAAKEEARLFITEIRRRFKTTLLLTTHDLKDVTELCQRLIFLDRGRVLFDGALKEFERTYASDRRIVIESRHPLKVALVTRLKGLVRKAGGRIQSSEGHRLTVLYKREEDGPRLAHALLGAVDAADFSLERADVETMVKKLYALQKQNVRL